MAVYFITRTSPAHVKIGKADNPQKRLASLMMGWSTGELFLRAVIPGDFAEENVIHKRFYAQRLRGEWFVLDDEVESVIAVAERHGSLDSLDWFVSGVAERKIQIDRESALGEYAVILAKNVRALRKGIGATQAELALSAGIPRASMANVESGAANPALSTMVKIAGALGVSIDELLVRK